MDRRIWRVIHIAEKVKPTSEKSKEKEKPEVVEVEERDLTEEEKKAKLQRLQALQDELNEMKAKEKEILEPSSAKSDGLETLETEISKGIADATKGEMLGKIKVDETNVDQELAALELEIAEEEKIIIIEKTPIEKLVEIHEWITQAQYGFMFVIPNKKKNKQDYESWKEEWSQVLFDYAKVGKFHVLYMKRLLTEEPFNKFDNRKKAIQDFAERLVEKDLAEWTGDKPKKKEELRIYWKSLSEWQDIIVKWAENNAILELILIPEIRKLKEDFANLPEEDLRKIFKQIEKDDKGQMVEIENNQFGIKFKLF